MSTLLETALAYHQLGYVPLWVEPSSKAAKSSGWQTITPTEESIRRHFSRPSNLGIRTGDVHSDGMLAVALDMKIDAGQVRGCDDARSVAGGHHRGRLAPLPRRRPAAARTLLTGRHP